MGNVGYVIGVVVAVVLLVAAGLTVGWILLRLIDRAPAGAPRYAYLLLVGTVAWGLVEVVLMGSNPGSAATWARVIALVWPLVFGAWVFERQAPAVTARAVFDAIPRARFWLVVAGVLAAMAATWPVESDVLRAPVLMVILAGGAVSLDRLGRNRLGAAGVVPSRS